MDVHVSDAMQISCWWDLGRPLTNIGFMRPPLNRLSTVARVAVGPGCAASGLISRRPRPGSGRRLGSS